MKKVLFTLALASAVVACKKEAPKDYVTLSGTITNQNSDSLCVAQRNIIKTIKVNPDGTFSDTLKVQPGQFVLFDGKEQAPVYLKNGFDLTIALDAKQFDESLTFTGNGEEANNYLAKKALVQEQGFDFNTLFSLEETAFNGKLNKVSADLKTLLSSTQNLDSAFVVTQEKEFEMMQKQMVSMYQQKQTLLALNGQDSPKFVDYENYKGGNTSLDDFKGKYVYIDLWATWCGPCKYEIPFLKEVEEKYHDKNIAFVSISLDRQNAYQTWKDMIAEKEMGGVQLYAKGDKSFASAYMVSGIPRFILVGPEGKVVNADAPRPSSSELINLFNSLNI